MKTKLITAIISDLMLIALFPHFFLHHAIGVFMLAVFVLSVGLLILLSRSRRKPAYAGIVRTKLEIENKQTSNMIPVNVKEFEQIVEILKGLGYKVSEAKIVAQQVLMDTQLVNFQDKVRKSVQMMDKN